MEVKVASSGCMYILKVSSFDTLKFDFEFFNGSNMNVLSYFKIPQFSFPIFTTCHLTNFKEACSLEYKLLLSIH